MLGFMGIQPLQKWAHTLTCEVWEGLEWVDGWAGGRGAEKSAPNLILFFY